jgi:plasmid stabilization system protein ParE
MLSVLCAFASLREILLSTNLVENRKYVNDLRDFPEMGAVSEEFNDPSIREINFRGQRILYRYDGVWVVIITVFHGSHVPNLSDLVDE